MKRFDMHIHTKESSECGKLCAKGIVDLYRNAGYDGFVVTDHSIPRYRKKYDSEAEMLRIQPQGYYAAKSYADTVGFTVLYGCELRFTEASRTDFLVYGITPDYLSAHPGLMDMSIVDGITLLQNDGALVYQAHPFRNEMQIVNPEILDGIEVYNGHTGYDSRNEFAFLWAKKYGLRAISGSDFHKVCDLAHGGLLLPDDVTDEKSLLAALKNESYQLIIDPQTLV